MFLKKKIFLISLVPINKVLGQRTHSIVKTQAGVEYVVPEAIMLEPPFQSGPINPFSIGKGLNICRFWSTMKCCLTLSIQE